jgi:hypothetical protein
MFPGEEEVEGLGAIDERAPSTPSLQSPMITVLSSAY